MHTQGIGVAVATRIEVQVQIVAGELAVDQLHAAQLDQAVAVNGRQTRGFRIQNNLTRHSISPNYLRRSHRPTISKTSAHQSEDTEEAPPR